MQETILLIIASALGALATFLLHKYGISVVVASCIIGLLGAGLNYFIKSPHLALVIFAGSFVGMTSTAVGSISLVLLAGALAGLIYKYSLHIFAGFGGRLGTIAFISTVISYFFLKILKGKTQKH